ncbi:hypothetical protein AB0O74_34750 [Streptomyces rubiginosohelvolus]|uniref:hypothetical protein n=1 Tax=Streptomyces rubiginosohelvolus TaxID=67362 RepID=UPI00342235E8
MSGSPWERWRTTRAAVASSVSRPSSATVTTRSVAGGVRVVRLVEQFLGADDEVLGDVADRLGAAGGPGGVDGGLGSGRAVRVGV